MLQELYLTNSSSFLLKTGTNQGQLHYMNTTTSALISCDNACKLPATMEGIIIFGNDNIINMSLLGVVHFWRCWSKILLGRYSCCSQSKNYLLDVGRAPMLSTELVSWWQQRGQVVLNGLDLLLPNSSLMTWRQNIHNKGDPITVLLQELLSDTFVVQLCNCSLQLMFSLHKIVSDLSGK